MSRDTFYITTAISYPNGKPHIGHAYELIATDALARFQRLDGKQVFFLTGTDEHGIKMLQTAKREGISARELADRNSADFRRMATALNASNDDFIRTTEERHYASSQAIWKAMAANGGMQAPPGGPAPLGALQMKIQKDQAATTLSAASAAAAAELRAEGSF